MSLVYMPGGAVDTDFVLTEVGADSRFLDGAKFFLTASAPNDTDSNDGDWWMRTGASSKLFYRQDVGGTSYWLALETIWAYAGLNQNTPPTGTNTLDLRFLQGINSSVSGEGWFPNTKLHVWQLSVEATNTPTSQAACKLMLDGTNVIATNWDGTNSVVHGSKDYVTTATTNEVGLKYFNQNALTGATDPRAYLYCREAVDVP